MAFRLEHTSQVRPTVHIPIFMSSLWVLKVPEARHLAMPSAGVGESAEACMLQNLISCCCRMQGRTDSGHLYVMDPTDILSTGARGIGSSPLRFELDTGHQGTAGAATSLHPLGHWSFALSRPSALPRCLQGMHAIPFKCSVNHGICL